ncbi:hypothetical protein JCM8097_005788 [Rhodosporidiobolus ruineniae]
MARTASGRRALAALLLLVCSASSVLAHEHHEEAPGPYVNNFTNDEEMDSTLKAHIAIQILSWGILFPAGMVLGITRSRFHVPLQTLTILLSLAGNSLGHHHAGRSFHMTAHAHFASYMWWYMISQGALGVFLKLHVCEGTALRKTAVLAHGIIGKSFPIFGWVQMVFGGIAALGFCFNDHLGQCLAHFIMGSAFIAYACILLLMLRVGAGWLARRKVSQEYLDSWVIMLWGIVNTFTEHNFLKPGQSSWNHKDLQHTSLGVLWWAGGGLGIFLSRNRKRSVVPALIIAMTGYAMANHGQSLEFSTTVHKFFGAALMAAGAARIVEICFVLRDSPTPEVTDTTGPSSFQHLTPFLLVLAGLTFMSATEEQMAWLAGSIMDSTTYSILLFSGSFGIYLVGVALVDLYEHQMRLKSAAQAVGVEQVEDIEGGGSPAFRSAGRDAEPIKVFGFTLPAAFGRLVDFGRRLEGGPEPRGRHLRSDTVEYESMPLTSSRARESVDVGAAGGLGDGGESHEMARRESGSGSGSGGSGGRGRGGRGTTVGSDETVFELGDYEDDGGDAYWAEKDELEAERRQRS